MKFWNENPYPKHLFDPGTALVGIGTGLSLIGADKRANAERKALRSQAAIQAAQADEKLRQLDVDLDIFEQQSTQALGEVASSYAAAGVDIGSGSPLLVQAQTERNLRAAEAEMERKGKEEARLLRAGAASMARSANRIDPTFEMLGTALGGIGQMIGNKKPEGEI